ncbi:hypothetical protein KP509_11G045300 [Ceratopteris richardii]|uniref:FAD-binding FR-type domain-containing protein n=1 Tax=Ceratopteris richardii TaxID=49495 RepID=A0A8T2TS22_CERRI|nr:hypothetical protein KP509_11G045300 [Ceratopteris richardii]
MTHSIYRRLAVVAKRSTEVVIAVACITWVMYWFFSPEPEFNEDDLSKHISSRFFPTDGREGYALIYQTVPWVVVAALSFLVIELRSIIRNERLSKGGGIFSRLSTYPLWVHSPLGILTASDILLIIGFLFVVMYHLGRTSYLSFKQIEAGTAQFYGPVVSKGWLKLDYVAYYLGSISVIPFAMLWIPVSRGSPFLRLIGVPFEHAVRYHIWLSVITIILVSLHSIGFIVFYMRTGQTNQITSWESGGYESAILAGLVAWIVGLVILITSLPFFRRRWYEFFFTVHHLYAVFALFWTYHAVWNHHYYIVPILLFCVDRFLRFLQSHKLVDVRSVRMLESGAVELRLPRSNTVTDKALSTWCIQFPSVSKIQWHFFSAASAHNKDSGDVAIIIKPVGGWTKRLHKRLLDASTSNNGSSGCPFSFKARVEGPYYDESNFYLRYESVILVGGGIGVTPLLAILQDIIQQRARGTHENMNIPTYVELYYCVRTPQELCVLDQIEPKHFVPTYKSLGLQIKVHAYITSETGDMYEAVPELLKNLGTNEPIDLSEYRSSTCWTSHTLTNKKTAISNISNLSAASSSVSVASITIFSMLGYFLLSGLANVYILKDPTGNFSNYSHAHVIVTCLILGTLGFGGPLAFIWHLVLNRKDRGTTRTQAMQSNSVSMPPKFEEAEQFYQNERNLEGGEHCTWDGDLRIGCRPDWHGVFKNLRQSHRGKVVGVLVSGAKGMQEDVASECRRHSRFLLPADENSVIFEHHAVSFSF